MKAYTFRIVSEENEDFLREIQILSDQSFLDFHDFIMEICHLQGNELASFYACTDEWHKELEISLIDMSIDDEDTDIDFDIDDTDPDVKPGRPQGLPVKVMEDTYLGNIVKRVNQRLIYEYDFFSPVVLFMECTAIEETESDEFPELLISKGQLEYLGGGSDDSDIIFESDFDLDDDFDDELSEDD